MIYILAAAVIALAVWCVRLEFRVRFLARKLSSVEDSLESFFNTADSAFRSGQEHGKRFGLTFPDNFTPEEAIRIREKHQEYMKRSIENDILGW